MEIIRIEPQGYCKGVIYALDIVKKAISDKSTKKPIYLLGNVIHNKKVMDGIKECGVIIIESKKPRFDMLDEIESGTVIFSAHGVSPRVYQKAIAKGLNVIDATCPNVLVVHNKIIKYLDEGYDVIYIGTKGHPESEGVIEISNSIHFITSYDDIYKLNISNDKIYITNQTTLSKLDLKDIFNSLKNKFPSALLDDKICLATTKRQEALLDQNGSELCVVVGDTTSSNSKKLKEVSEKYGNVKSVLVEGVTDIDDTWFKNIKKVSVTSGASTPNEITDKVIEHIKSLKD